MRRRKPLELFSAATVPQAHYHNIAVKPSEMQKEMVASLAERAEKVCDGAAM